MATSTGHRPFIDRELKTERLDLRVAPSAKLIIQRAMAVSGLTAGDLVYEEARRILDEHERMVLTRADRDAFLAAAREPSKSAKDLQAALRNVSVSEETLKAIEAQVKRRAR